MTDRETAEDIAQEAARWVVRMEGDAWTDGDEAALQAWLGGGRRRRGALLQAQAAWTALEPGIHGEARGADQSRVFTRRRTVILGGGAAVAASLVGGVLLSRTGTTYRTEIGEIRSVPLSDGSTATINSLSEVRFRLAGGEREVRLARGEAWFRVAKDPHRPFVVEAGDVKVRAVGTAFSVRRREGGADILVTEGVVEAWASAADGHIVRLVAGQQAFVGDNSAIYVKQEEPSAVDRALSWRAGSIDLYGRNLAEAVEEFNRYNRRKIVLSDAELAKQGFDGLFRTDDPEGFARTVGQSFNVPVDLADPNVIQIGRTREAAR